MGSIIPSTTANRGNRRFSLPVVCLALMGFSLQGPARGPGDAHRDQLSGDAGRALPARLKALPGASESGLFGQDLGRAAHLRHQSFFREAIDDFIEPRQALFLKLLRAVVE